MLQLKLDYVSHEYITKTPEERFSDNRQIVDIIAGSLIKKYAPFCQYEELVQWGLIGLWDACKRYNGPENEFRNYAKFRINGQIIDEIRVTNAFVRRLKKEDHPKFVDIFDLQLPYEQVSVDDLVNTRRQLNKILNSMSNVLTDKEKFVLNLYCFKDYSLSEIGRLLKLTEARVCQIKTGAIQKIIDDTGYNDNFLD